MDSRSDALNPSGGEPMGHVSNSQVMLRGVAGASEEPVPDLFSVGAERTVCEGCKNPASRGDPITSP
jgi:hypothetical protein